MGAGYGMSTMTTDRTPEAQKDQDHIRGLISLGPPSSRAAAGSRTFWSASTHNRETTRVVDNNTLNTASARGLLSIRRSAGNAS